MPARWRCWFAAGLLHLRLRIRPKPKAVDFHDAENRQRACRRIIRHEKDSLSVRLALMFSAKLNPSLHHQILSAPSQEETRHQNCL
ncbi:hypothetical protein TNCV_2381661 [Trichonephila clavipes]|nr:hypothetical protein TNCV_2381661 [Trichonephila clavipes]